MAENKSGCRNMLKALSHAPKESVGRSCYYTKLVAAASELNPGRHFSLPSLLVFRSE